MNHAASRPDRPDSAARAARWPWLLTAHACLALGATGVVLPVVPTTPFLLVAFWAALRGSPGLARRILRHPRYGPLVKAWQRHGAVPVCAKWLASGMLALSWLIIWQRGTSVAWVVLVTVLFALVAAFLWSRPVPRGDQTNPPRPGSRHRA